MLSIAPTPEVVVEPAVMDSIINEVLSAARVRMQDDGRVR